jgi:putative phosphoesterase
VRLGILADVHCNAPALASALDALDGEVDDVLFAGDAVLQYRFSNEVIECIRDSDLAYVVGNHELTLLGAHGRTALSAPHIRAANVDWMANAPTSHERRVSGKTLLMVHASPFAPYSDYLYPGSPELARCAELDVDLLVLGHTHQPMAVRVGRTLVVNPGSLGQGGDPNHPGMLSYGVLDTDSEEFVVHRFADPRFA